MSIVEHRVFGKLLPSFTEEGGSLSNFVTQDDIESFDLVWSSKRSKRYKPGQEIMVLDDSGMHDSKIKIASSRVIVSQDDPDMMFLATTDSHGRKSIDEYDPRRDRIKGHRGK